MSKSKSVSWVLGAGMAVLAGCLIITACLNSDTPGHDTFFGDSGASDCADQMDNDGDSTADRYGWPSHCTVETPIRQTASGSMVEFFATGIFIGNSVDVYTVVVMLGTGDIGGPTMSWTSNRGDNGGPMPIIGSTMMAVGTKGLVVFFMDADGLFSLTAGETWTIRVKPSGSCTILPDGGCFHPDSTTETDACSNNIDDDGDFLVDENDPGCMLDCIDGTTASRYVPGWFSEVDTNAPVPECNDGIDNDLDGGTDFGGFPRDLDCADSCGLFE